jgi:hypothetical protein
VEKQRPIELVTKFFVFNSFSYRSEWDFHDYLDEGSVSLALDPAFDRNREAKSFKEVFDLIYSELGSDAFRRTRQGRIVGSFSDAAFEAITVGIRSNLTHWRKKDKGTLKSLADKMWSKEDFAKNTGAGVRGTTRISKLVPFARSYFKK